MSRLCLATDICCGCETERLYGPELSDRQKLDSRLISLKMYTSIFKWFNLIIIVVCARNTPAKTRPIQSSAARR